MSKSQIFDKEFYGTWMAKAVVVFDGPFKDWRGVVCRTEAPLAEVAFPLRDETYEQTHGDSIERVWFDVGQLRKS